MHQAKKSILVIDDAPESIDVLVFALSENYRIIAALSGEDAVEILQRKSTPDLVVTDINMPGMSGYDVCEYMRARLETKNIPVIFVSGTLSAEELKKGKGVGGNDFIKKPVSVQEIRHKVDKMVVRA